MTGVVVSTRFGSQAVRQSPILSSLTRHLVLSSSFWLLATRRGWPALFLRIKSYLPGAMFSLLFPAADRAASSDLSPVGLAARFVAKP